MAVWKVLRISGPNCPGFCLQRVLHIGHRTLHWYMIYLHISSSFFTGALTPKVIEEYACFNTIFEISCRAGEKIVFESARYGRNDTVISRQCQVPYQRTCDIDVHFPLNRACGGKPKCNLAVNTALFNDPCGYDEFLKVSYRCASGKNWSTTWWLHKFIHYLAH